MIFFFIYIYIYIIKLRWRHSAPWHFISPSLPNPYHPSLLAGLLGCILCLHRRDVNPCWLTHTVTSMRSSPWENVTDYLICDSSAFPHISCSSLRDGRLVTIQLLFVGCRFLDWLNTAFNILEWFHLAFSQCDLLTSMRCIHIVV